MIRLASSLSLAIALAMQFALPASAQVRSDRVRLDEFSAPPASGGIEIAQVPQATGATLPQISRGDGAAPLVQAGKAGDRTTAAMPALSRRADGKPAAVERLTGSDRCDPVAQERRNQASCAGILEMRSGEFSATAAPRLSPEQQLLARQYQTGPTSQLGGTGTARLAREADPEGRQAQELGFVGLPPPPPEPDARSTAPNPDVAPDNALSGILVQLGAPPQQ